MSIIGNLNSTLLAAILLTPALAFAQNKIQPAAPIPTQISTAHRIFLSNAIDWNYTSSARDYNALYAALKSWGKYELVSTPTEAELVFEMLYVTNSGAFGGATSTTLTIHILDRSTRTVLWSINEYPSIGGFTEAGKEHSSATTAIALINDLKVLSQPNATAAESQAMPSTPQKTRFSKEKP